MNKQSLMLRNKSSKLSVIIFARNEEEMIRDCLESVKWADEIVFIDNGSIDKTCKIAKKYKAEIFEKKKGSFSDLRNFGAEKAKGDWLFYVDADERVPPLLRKEIQSAISNYSAFAIPRRNIRLGKEMRFGGWWPDYVLRLVRKDRLEGWQGELHEQPEIEGEIGKLENALVHFSHRGSIEHKVENTIDWSRIEAKLLHQSGHPPMNVARFLSAMGGEFFQRMIKKQAWRDGTEGVIETIYQVFSVFISYARLWELQCQTQN